MVLALAVSRRSAGLLIALALVAALLTSCGRSEGADQVADADRVADCVPISTETESVPRLWIEATLDAIRLDFPAPTVHARNLWHLSAAMWDAHAAYSTTAQPYFDATVESLDQSEPDAPATAISYAAHRLLRDRYEFAIGGATSLAAFDQLMLDLCHDIGSPPQARPVGSPAAVGLAIADAAISFGSQDGSLEINRYIDLSYQPVNPPLEVNTDIIEMSDPNRWQPLQLSERVTQNGQAQGPGTQIFIGSNWGSVTSFALPSADADGVTLDPGPPPLLGTETGDDFVDAVVQLIGYSDLLGGESGAELIDIGPGPMHAENPITGQPYAPNRVPHGDYGRAIAEFWADGPDSETPPGHWNTLAIETSDVIAADDLRWAGTGPVLDRNEWDLRLFFSLNASLHDTAIAVWGSKRAYDYARPISMVRYLGSGNVPGLPTVPGLIETVTSETATSAGRHAGLPIGETVVRSWLGPGVGWSRAIDWLPYQRPTFVSPAFAAYVSGHSGFSRAAADILASATASEFFPGAMFTHTVPTGSLRHEEGPSVDVELQWATYRDAADEAGLSRRYGGIHVEADDLAGRVLGAEIASSTWSAAQSYFGL